LTGGSGEDSAGLFPKAFSESLGVDFFEAGILLSPLPGGGEREGLVELMMRGVFSVSFFCFFWGLLDLDLLVVVFFLAIVVVCLPRGGLFGDLWD
jgi:hypothetical protein